MFSKDSGQDNGDPRTEGHKQGQSCPPWPSPSRRHPEPLGGAPGRRDAHRRSGRSGEARQHLRKRSGLSPDVKGRQEPGLCGGPHHARPGSQGALDKPRRESVNPLASALLNSQGHENKELRSRHSERNGRQGGEGGRLGPSSCRAATPGTTGRGGNLA